MSLNTDYPQPPFKVNAKLYESEHWQRLSANAKQIYLKAWFKSQNGLYTFPFITERRGWFYDAISELSKPCPEYILETTLERVKERMELAAATTSPYFKLFEPRPSYRSGIGLLVPLKKLTSSEFEGTFYIAKYPTYVGERPNSRLLPLYDWAVN